MRTLKASTSFGAYTDSDLEIKAGAIIENLTGNVTFPDPVPALATVQGILNDYSAALVQAANQDRVEVAAKNQLRGTLEGMLAQLGMYVSFVANGNAAQLTSSGFSFTKMPEPSYISNPGNVSLSNGITSGELVAKVKGVKGAKTYLHQLTPDPLTADSVWQSTPSSRSLFTFQNLQAGKKYWVRIAALGSGQQIAYSPVNSQFVQ